VNTTPTEAPGNESAQVQRSVTEQHHDEGNLSGTAAGARRLSVRAFLLFVAAFWIYISITRISQWELLRQGSRTMPGLSLDVFIVQDSLLLPVLMLLCLVSYRIGYDMHRWQWRAAGHFAVAIVFGLAGRPMLILARALVEDITILESLALMDGQNPLKAAKLYASAVLDMGLQYVVLQGLITGFTYFARYRHEQWLRARLETEYERARLNALRMQINPHFLYNTLSAIAGLVRSNPAAAETMVTRLGELFRRALSNRNSELVPLCEEIEHGEQYLEIQRARFEDRLVYHLMIEPQLERTAIPPLLLQPLLENAVEHGLGKTQGDLSIDILCEAQGNEVALTVRNTGQQLATEPQQASAMQRGRHGFGLKSVRERLEAAFGAGASFALANTGPGQFEARLRFPRLLLAES